MIESKLDKSVAGVTKEKQKIHKFGQHRNVAAIFWNEKRNRYTGGINASSGQMATHYKVTSGITELLILHKMNFSKLSCSLRKNQTNLYDTKFSIIKQWSIYK